MKTIKFFHLITVVVILVISILSCRKEIPSIVRNQAPFANAGPDQIINLPATFGMLDGSASNDPSGTLLNFLWRQISGRTITISNATSKTSTVYFNKTGIYEFELKVWNSNGVAYDTTKVMLNSNNYIIVTITEHK